MAESFLVASLIGVFTLNAFRPRRNQSILVLSGSASSVPTGSCAGAE